MALLLTVEDVIANPGEPVQVRVQLEKRICLFVDPAVAGEEIELQSFGRATTDRDGIARWTLPPLPPGLHRLTASCREEQVEGLAAVFERDEPAIVTDIDRTIADVTPLEAILRSNASIRQMPGASDALRTLAERMRIVYLSARDHIFVAKTRAWLRSNEFPEGPLFLRRIRFTSASPLTHKLSRLAEIAPRLRNIRFGVGDKPHDVEAYRCHGIPPILLSPKGDVRSWAEIVERFSGGGSRISRMIP